MDGDNNTAASGADDEQVEWSNMLCIAIAYSDFFPAAVKNMDVQKNIVDRFVDYYLGGRSLGGLEVTDLVFSVLSIMPLNMETEDFMWPDNNYRDSGRLFALTPEDKLKIEIEKIFENASKGKPCDNEDDKLTVKIDKAETNAVDNDVMQTFKESDDVKDNINKENNNKIFSEAYEDLEDSKSDKTEDTGKKETQFESCKTENTQDKEAFKFPDVNWFSRNLKIESKLAAPLKYGPVENAAFISGCRKLLATWDTNKNSRIELKYFFGIIALTLMRGTTKTYKHLVNTFSSNNYNSLLPTLSFQYFVPHKRCIKRSYRTFRKKSDKTRIMFAKIVLNYYYHTARHNYEAVTILRRCILSHTSHYGLGLVSLLQTIHSNTGTNINVVIEVTQCKETEESWRRLKEYVDKYISVDSKEGAHFWARIIYKDCLKYLSCTCNYTLAVILAVFVEKITNDTGIWKSAWVESESHNLESLKTLGVNMYDQYVSKIKLLEGTRKTSVPRENKSFINDGYAFAENSVLCDDDTVDFHDDIFSDNRDNILDDLLSDNRDDFPDDLLSDNRDDFPDDLLSDNRDDFLDDLLSDNRDDFLDDLLSDNRDDLLDDIFW